MLISMHWTKGAPPKIEGKKFLVLEDNGEFHVFEYNPNAKGFDPEYPWQRGYSGTHTGGTSVSHWAEISYPDGARPADNQKK